MQNFGKIKNSFNTILVENIVKKNGSNKLFKDYIKTIRENEVLKTQFLVYNNIENKVESDESKVFQFVKENIDLFSKFDRKDILGANTKLAESIPSEALITNYENAELHENITKLIFTKRTANTIDEIVEATSEVVKHILNNKVKEINESIDLPMSMVSTILVDRYNEKYSSLDESDKSILKAIIDSNDEEKKVVYVKILRECIDLIDIKLKDSDVESKDKLLRVKDKLLNDKQDVSEDFVSKIGKLVDLKSSLHND